MGGVVVIVVLAVIVVAVAWLDYGRNKEVVSEVEVLNPAGKTGTALVVYHPGKSDFQRRVFSGFVEGLVSNGWRVENTTPSAQTPTDLSSFDLLVLGGPTYWFTPNRPIRRYLNRLGDLGGQPAVTIITALGAGERSASIMQKQVREANEPVSRQVTQWRGEIVSLFDEFGLATANFGGYGPTSEPTFSYRLAQFEAGIGVSGRFGACLNPDFGCYDTVGVLLTEAELYPTDKGLLEGFAPCDDCTSALRSARYGQSIHPMRRPGATTVTSASGSSSR